MEHAVGRELVWIALAGVAMILLLDAVLSVNWQSGPVLQWGLQSFLIWCYVIVVIVRKLHLNRLNTGGREYGDIGWANRLTIARGGLIAATGGFLFLEPPPGILIWAPGLFYCMAAILDRLDGYIARKSGHTSLLGVELDTVFDALGLAVAPLLAVWYGKIHWTYLIFSAAWYLFRWGIFMRERSGLPVHALPPSPVRRAWAGFQMGFIGVVLLPVFGPPLTRVAGVAFVIPVLIGFLIDWLVVSGRIDRADPATSRRLHTVHRLIHSLMLPCLRLLVAVLAVIIAVATHDPIATIMILVAAFVLAGLAGRAAALTQLILSGFYYQDYPFDLTALVLTYALIWIMLLGTGRGSLWTPDERWINRYDGA